MLDTSPAPAKSAHFAPGTRPGSISPWEGDCVRGARLAQLGLLREVRRRFVDPERVRRELMVAILRYGWPMTRPESLMAEITWVAAGRAIN